MMRHTSSHILCMFKHVTFCFSFLLLFERENGTLDVSKMAATALVGISWVTYRGPPWIPFHAAKLVLEPAPRFLRCAGDRCVSARLVTTPRWSRSRTPCATYLAVSPRTKYVAARLL
jgi:hypothetical protein